MGEGKKKVTLFTPSNIYHKYFKIIWHGMVIQTKDDKYWGALESSAKILLTYPLLHGHGSSSLNHSKLFMPKNSIGARVNSVMGQGGKDRTGVDPELLQTYPIKAGRREI